jgi:hypothetical protein
VRAGALVCASCGADPREDDEAAAERTRQELDLPESSLDDDRYDEFVREELEGGTIKTTPPSRTAIFLIILVVVGVAAVLALLTKGKP